MADNPAVTTATELLKTLENEQLKQHVIRDDQKRIKFLFEAKWNAKEGDPCLVTEYTYFDSEFEVKGRQERVYKWKAAWDGNFEFDPSVDYDPDGNGELP